MVITPTSRENPLWIVVDKKIFISLVERFPYGSGSFTRYKWRGWDFQDRIKSHLEMGGAFVVVTPGRNWLYLCNAEALLDVIQTRIDFPSPLELYGSLRYTRSKVAVLRNGKYFWSKPFHGRNGRNRIDSSSLASRVL